MNTNIEYEVKLSANLGNVVPQVGELTNQLETHLSAMGIPEKPTIRSTMFGMVVKCDREMTQSEKELMKETVVSAFKESYPAWEVRVESFRRKSCNSESLASSAS